MRELLGALPPPPGFIACCLSRCWACCGWTKKGMPHSIPRYRSVEATESALRLLPSIALSSAQSGLILLWGGIYRGDPGGGF